MKKLLPIVTILFFLLNGCTQKEPDPTVANFTFTLIDGNTVSFQNTSTNAELYEWDFGNGAKSNDKNPSIQYAKNGDYSVVLVAKTSKSQDTKTQRVTVVAAPKPVAKFSYKSLGKGLISFTNESTNADNYKWTFGNGNQSTEQAPQMQYQTNGTFEVKLEAINFNGMTESKQNIIVDGIPVNITHDSNKQIIPIGGNSWLTNFGRAFL